MMAYATIYENNKLKYVKVGKRNNTQILQDNINDCANRIEIFEKQKFTLDNYEQLHDMIWNATNVVGKLQEIINKLDELKEKIETERNLMCEKTIIKYQCMICNDIHQFKYLAERCCEQTKKIIITETNK